MRGRWSLQTCWRKSKKKKANSGLLLGAREMVVGPGGDGAGGGGGGYKRCQWRVEEGWEKTGNDICRCPFSWHTVWASHLLGPFMCFSIPHSFTERLWATHIPDGRVRPGRFYACWAVHGWAHIPQQKGGARSGVDACGWGRMAVERAMVMIEERGWANINRDAVDVWFKLRSPRVWYKRS